MKSYSKGIVIALGFLVLTAMRVNGQYGWCDPAKLSTIPERDYRIIDARPSAVNKYKGKTEFKKRAQIAIVNMNPFVFKYDVRVNQTPIADQAFLDFLKLLGGPITDLPGIASLRAVTDSQDAEELAPGGDLARLISRTGGAPAAAPNYIAPPPPAGTCAAGMIQTATDALDYLAETRDEMLRLKDAIEQAITNDANTYTTARTAYLSSQDILYGPSSDAAQLCRQANILMIGLLGDPNGGAALHSTYATRDVLNKLKAEIEKLNSLILELKNSATSFKGDTTLSSCQARLRGFDYATSLISLADAMTAYRVTLEKKAKSMSDETKAYDLLAKSIWTFAGTDANGNPVPNGGPGVKLLQNTFDIDGQFEISALDVELVRTELNSDKPFTDIDEVDALRQQLRASNDANSLNGFQRFAIRGVNVTTVGDIGLGNDSTSESRLNSSTTRLAHTRNSDLEDSKPAEEGSEPATNGGAKTRTIIGARRFELSGGMAFSTLNRREFQTVLGYARNPDGVIIDADGKPTDKRELTKIVGISESSKSRFSPMAMLHTRLTNNPRYNMFFSAGVTAKNGSSGVDVEYMIGPSFNFLNKNIFLTFGGYAGREQKLAGDLFVGAKVSDNDLPVTKHYKWAPAFSFTYRIPVGGGSSN